MRSVYATVGAATQDLRFALRVMLKDRWVTLLAVLALGLGLGANNTVFTCANAVLLKGLPFEEPDRIVYLGSQTRNQERQSDRVSYPDFLDWREQATTLSDLGAFFAGTMNVADDDHPPERIAGAWVSANTFTLLGQQPLLGRDFAPGEDEPGAAAVVLLGYGIWQNRYGGDPGILGRTIRVNEIPTTVVGVMPEGMRFPFANDLWQPLDGADDRDRRDRRTVSVFGRLAPDVTLEQARTEMRGITARLAERYPDTNEGIEAFVQLYNDQFNGELIKLMFLVLLGAVGFVLLIACANVANLLLARSLYRGREIAMRTALGATRARLARQLLTESLLLGLFGGTVGLTLSVAGVRLFARAVADVGKPYWIDFSMDWRVFTYFLAVSIATAVLFGLAPALQGSGLDVNRTLRESGRSGGRGKRTRRFTRSMVVFQLALTIVLLFGAGLMVRSFLALYRMDVVLETENLLTMRLGLVEGKYPGPSERVVFHERLAETLAAAPGIESAAVSSHPLLGYPSPRGLFLEGRPSEADEPLADVGVHVTSPGYFATLGLRPLRGRPFGDTDGETGSQVALVNERFTEMFFPNEDPLGQRMRLRADETDGPWLTIVGVVPTMPNGSARAERPPAVVYLPYRQEPVPFVHLFVRGTTGPAALAASVRQAVLEIDPDLPVFSIRTADEAIAERRWPFAVFGSLFAVFAAIALALAAIGVYGVMAYGVSQRTTEIGVRMMLGARARDVRWLVLRQALVEIALGVILGLLGALFAGTTLAAFLVRVTPRDPATLASVAVILVGVSAAACVVPVRRAARLNPIDALREASTA